MHIWGLRRNEDTRRGCAFLAVGRSIDAFRIQRSGVSLGMGCGMRNYGIGGDGFGGYKKAS